MASAGDKKTPSQGYLEDVPLSSSQATFLRNVLKQSYLDSSYVSSSLSVVSIQTIHNAELGRQFLQKRTEMQALNRSRQELKELYGFTVARKSNVFLKKVVANGLKVQETSYNAFGDSSKGIYVSKHCDVMLKFAENHHDQCRFLRILVHRLVPGKLLSTNHGTDKLPPSEHFDGHIALVRPAIDNNLLVQVMLSQIYIYELDHENKPVTHPRQCLPYAVITFERTPGSTIPQGMSNEQTNQPKQQQHLTIETKLRQIKCKIDQNEKQQVDLRLLSEKPQTKMPVTASGLLSMPVTLGQQSAPSRSAPTISTASIPAGGTPPQSVITFRDITSMQSAIVGSIPTPISPISPQASHLGSNLTSSSMRPSMVGTILTPNSPQASHIRSNQACSTIMPSIVGSIPTPNSPQTLHLGSNLTCSTPMTTIVGSIPTTNVPQTSYFGSNRTCITIGSPMVGSISTPNSPQASHFVSNLTSPTIAKAQYIRIISASEAQKLLQNTPGKTKLMFASPIQSTQIPQVRAATSSVSGRGCNVSKVAIPGRVATSVSGRGCDVSKVAIPGRVASSVSRGCDVSKVAIPGRVATSVSGRGYDVSKVAIPGRVATSVSGRGCDVSKVAIPGRVATSVSGRGCDVSKVAIPGRVATQATVRPTLLYPVQQKSIQPLKPPGLLRSIAPKGQHMLVTSPVRNLREVSYEHQPQNVSDFVNGTVPPMTSENSQTLGDPDFSTVKPIEIAPIEGYDEPAICVKQERRGGTTAANSVINLIEDDDCPSVTNSTPVVTTDPPALSSYASDHQEVLQPSLQQQIAEFALVEEQVALAHQVAKEVPSGVKEIIHHRPQKREENPPQLNTEVIPEPQIAVKIRECEAAVAPQHVSQSMASSPGLPDLPPVVSEVKPMPVAIEGPNLKENDKQKTPTKENADNEPKKVLHHYVRTTEDGSIEVVGEMVLESELAKRQAEMNLSANQSWDLDSLDDEDDGDMTAMISETTLKIVSTSSGSHAKDSEDGNEQGGTSLQRSSDRSSSSVHKADTSPEGTKEASSLPPVKRSEPNMCTSQSELLDGSTDHSGTCTGLQSDKKSSQSELTTVQSTDAEAAHPATVSPLSSVSKSCAIVKQEEDGETELKTIFKNDGVEINGTMILSEALLIDVQPNFQPPAPDILDQPHNVSKDCGVNSHDGMGTVSNERSSPSKSKVSGKLSTKKSAGNILRNKQKSSNTLVSKNVKERPPKHKAKCADKIVHGTVRTVSTDEIRQRSYLGHLDSSHSLRLSLTDFQPTDPTAEDFTEFDTDIDFTPISIYPNGVYERIAWEAAEKDPAYQPVVKLMDVKNTQRHYAAVQPPSPVRLSDDGYALPKPKPSKLKIKAIPTWSPKMRKLLTARKSVSKGSMLPLRHGVKLSHPSFVPSTTNCLSFTTTTLPGSMDSLCAYDTPSATSGKKDTNKTVSTALPDSEHEASKENQGEKSISMTLELTKKTNILEPIVEVESAKITEAAQKAKTSPVIGSEIKIPNVGKKKCKAPVKKGKQSLRTKSSSSKDDGTSSSGTEYTMPRQKKNKQCRILPVRRGRSLAAFIQENPIGVPNEELGYHLEMSLSLAEGKKISEGNRKKGEKKVCRVKENQVPETTKSFFDPQIPLIRKDPTYVERTMYKPEIPGILDAPAEGPLKKNEAPEEVPVKEDKKPAGLEGPMELVTNDTAFLALLQSRLLLAKTEAEAESLKATIAVLCPINKSKSDTGLQNSNKKTAIVASKSTLPIELDDFDYDEDIAADEKKIPCPTGGPTLADSEDQVTLASSFQNTPCDDGLVDLQDERWKILHALEGLEEEDKDAAPSTVSKQREENSTKASSTSGKNKGPAKSKKSKKHRNEPPHTLHGTTLVGTGKTEGPVEAILSEEEEIHKTRLNRSRRKRILSSDSESDGEVGKKGRSGKQDTDHVATNKVVVKQNSKRPREHSEENHKRKRSKSMLYTDSEVIQNMLIPTTVPKKEETNLFNGYGEKEVRNSGNVDQWIQEIDKISQSPEDSKVGNVLERVIASTKPSVITDAGHSTMKTSDESKDSSSKDVDISINVKGKEIEAHLEVEEGEIETSPEIKERECDTSAKVNEKEIETSTEVEESEKSRLQVTCHPGKINAEDIKAHSEKEVEGRDINAQTECVSNSVNPDQLEAKTLNKKPKKQKLDINTYFARVAQRRNSASIDESGKFNPSTAGNLEKVVQATAKEIPLAIPDLNTNDIRKILENVYKNDQVLHRHTSKSGSATVERDPSSVKEGVHNSSASIPIEQVMTPEEILFRVGYLQDNIENVCMKRKELIADMAVIKRKLASNPKPDILKKLEKETQNLDPFIIGLYIDEDIIKRELDKVRGKVKGQPNQPVPTSLLLTDEVEPLQTQTRIPLVLMTKLLNDNYEALSSLKLDYMALNAQWRSTDVLDSARFRTLQGNYAFVKDQRYKILTMLCKSKDLRISARKYYDEVCYYRKWRDTFYNDYKKNSNPCTKDRIQFIDTKIAELDAHINLLCKVLGLPREVLRSPNRYELQSPNVPVQCGQTVFRSVGPNETPGRAKAEQEEKPPSWTISEAKITGEKPPWSRPVHATSQKPPCPVTSGNITNCPALPFSIETPPWLQKRCQKLAKDGSISLSSQNAAHGQSLVPCVNLSMGDKDYRTLEVKPNSQTPQTDLTSSSHNVDYHDVMRANLNPTKTKHVSPVSCQTPSDKFEKTDGKVVKLRDNLCGSVLDSSSQEKPSISEISQKTGLDMPNVELQSSLQLTAQMDICGDDAVEFSDLVIDIPESPADTEEKSTLDGTTEKDTEKSQDMQKSTLLMTDSVKKLDSISHAVSSTEFSKCIGSTSIKEHKMTNEKTECGMVEPSILPSVGSDSLLTRQDSAGRNNTQISRISKGVEPEVSKESSVKDHEKLCPKSWSGSRRPSIDSKEHHSTETPMGSQIKGTNSVTIPQKSTLPTSRKSSNGKIKPTDRAQQESPKAERRVCGTKRPKAKDQQSSHAILEGSKRSDKHKGCKNPMAKWQQCTTGVIVETRVRSDVHKATKQQSTNIGIKESSSCRKKSVSEEQRLIKTSPNELVKVSAIISPKEKIKSVEVDRRRTVLGSPKAKSVITKDWSFADALSSASCTKNIKDGKCSEGKKGTKKPVQTEPTCSTSDLKNSKVKWVGLLNRNVCKTEVNATHSSKKGSTALNEGSDNNGVVAKEPLKERTSISKSQSVQQKAEVEFDDEVKCEKSAVERRQELLQQVLKKKSDLTKILADNKSLDTSRITTDTTSAQTPEQPTGAVKANAKRVPHDIHKKRQSVDLPADTERSVNVMPDSTSGTLAGSNSACPLSSDSIAGKMILKANKTEKSRCLHPVIDKTLKKQNTVETVEMKEKERTKSTLTATPVPNVEKGKVPSETMLTATQELGNEMPDSTSGNEAAATLPDNNEPLMTADSKLKVTESSPTVRDKISSAEVDALIASVRQSLANDVFEARNKISEEFHNSEMPPNVPDSSYLLDGEACGASNDETQYARMRAAFQAEQSMSKKLPGVGQGIPNVTSHEAYERFDNSDPRKERIPATCQDHSDSGFENTQKSENLWQQFIREKVHDGDGNPWQSFLKRYKPQRTWGESLGKHAKGSTESSSWREEPRREGSVSHSVQHGHHSDSHRSRSRSPYDRKRNEKSVHDEDCRQSLRRKSQDHRSQERPSSHSEEKDYRKRDERSVDKDQDHRQRETKGRDSQDFRCRNNQEFRRRDGRSPHNRDYRKRDAHGSRSVSYRESRH